MRSGAEHTLHPVVGRASMLYNGHQLTRMDEWTPREIGGPRSRPRLLAPASLRVSHPKRERRKRPAPHGLRRQARAGNAMPGLLALSIRARRAQNLA